MLNRFLKFVDSKWSITDVSEVNPLPVNIVSSSNPLPLKAWVDYFRVKVG